MKTVKLGAHDPLCPPRTAYDRGIHCLRSCGDLKCSKVIKCSTPGLISVIAAVKDVVCVCVCEGEQQIERSDIGVRLALQRCLRSEIGDDASEWKRTICEKEDCSFLRVQLQVPWKAALVIIVFWRRQLSWRVGANHRHEAMGLNRGSGRHRFHVASLNATTSL